MNTLIISGGSIEVGLALEFLKKDFDHVIAVDGGAAFCHACGICPDRIVGDFDTLDPEILAWYREHTEAEIREYNPVKDATDTQIAVELAMELGSTDITILGGTGTRMDHVLGNIQTLYFPLERGVSCRIVDGYNQIQLIRGRHVIRKDRQYGTCFSLIPLTTDVYGVTIRGAKYPLEGHHFTVLGSGSFGVSNEVSEDQAEIFTDSGILILIESRDEAKAPVSPDQSPFKKESES